MILNRYIDAHKKDFISNLDEAVAIRSVSAWPETRSEIVKMVKWVAEKVEKLGGTTELKDVGKQVFHFPYNLNIPYRNNNIFMSLRLCMMEV